MWAHYAKNHEGFVIEFDEEILKKHFKDFRFDNVIYKDTKDEGLEDLLARAHVIRKPRYTHMLHRRLFFVAYFTKNSCWSYESERRMLIDEKETYKIDENIIIDIPYSAVKSIILGARCSKNTSDKIIKMCNNFRLNHYKTRIGKSSTKPYFLTKNGRTSIFKDGCFSVSKNYCTKCGEPTSLKKHCGWCAINELHIIAAQQKNVYRILASAGILESYIDGMNNIGKSIKNN